MLVRKNLAKLPPKRRGVIYTTFRASPTCIDVLANGSQLVLRARVPRNDYAMYECSKGWLVEVTSPTEIAREEKIAAERRAAAEHVRAAAKAPGFRALVAALTESFGNPEPFRQHDVDFLLFRAPRRTRVAAEWIARARAAGGAATLYDDGRALALVAGPLSGLLAAFYWDTWSRRECRVAIDMLDRASDAQLAIIDTVRERFELTLARVPANVDAHAKRLLRAFAINFPARLPAYAKGLRRRRLLIK